ncbi:hypothetical protein DY218_27340 [Streptomyces triticagri]|uniref:Uncharacterized protein n=1 Tax=Streptomyces triticagri TaxID=2293568 RepID=A0A372LY73_9ACTN|nr:DUF6415 family natural product biosynthesis protein [Streptomyces triticagri]RFU83624.1 hypothetical protein DY218_27340 [Streptomyces triticagri]
MTTAEQDPVARDTTDLPVDAAAIGLTCDYALSPHYSIPPRQEVDDLTDQLRHHLRRLLHLHTTGSGQPTDMKVRYAVHDAHMLLTADRVERPVAGYIRMRALARVCRVLASASPR